VDTLVDLELPNINFTDSDGITTSVASMEDVVCTPLVVNEWFELEIDTRIAGDSPSDSFNFRAFAGSSLEIDWESDGNIEYISNVVAPTDANLTHQYPTEGIKTLRARGYLSLSYRLTAENDKILTIKNMGNSTFNDFSMYGATNLTNTSTDKGHLIGTSCKELFKNTSIVTPPVLSYEYATNFQEIFRDTSLNADLGYMDLRRATTVVFFALGVTTWSQANYEATWAGFLRMTGTDVAPPSGWVLPSALAFYGGNATVSIGSLGAAARSYVINTLGWTVIDGGEI
jgi:hypothetical protein